MLVAARKYLAYFAGSFKSQFIYRSATVMGIFRSVLQLGVQIALWSALIGSGARSDVSFPEMMAFVFINSLMQALTDYGVIDEIGVSIRDGSVVMHLIRPISYQGMLLSTMLGKNAYRLLTTALPSCLLAAIAFGMPLPLSVPHGLLFLLMAVIGFLILFQLIYITGLLAFWSQSVWYLSWYLDAGLMLFGGTMIPLWFYPVALQIVSRYLPFRYITFEAINCYLGRSTLEGAAQSLGIAALWLLILQGVGLLIWRRAQAKMTINGG